MNADISAHPKLCSPASNLNREGGNDRHVGPKPVTDSFGGLSGGTCQVEPITHDRFSPWEGVTSSSFHVFKPAGDLLVRMI